MTTAIVILAGQSNASGTLSMSANLSGMMGSPSTDVEVYMSAFGDAGLLDSWETLATGFGQTTTRFGPELPIALTLRAQPALRSRRWRIIKVAVPSTSLDVDWAPGTGSQWADLAAAVPAALAALPGGESYEIVGCVWHQGCADAGDAGMAARYEANLTAFIAAVRALVGKPALPFVAAKITTVLAQSTAVRDAVAAAAAADAMVEAVEAGDFNFDTDGVHLETIGMWQYGKRAALALAGLL